MGCAEGHGACRPWRTPVYGNHGGCGETHGSTVILCRRCPGSIVPCGVSLCADRSTGDTAASVELSDLKIPQVPPKPVRALYQDRAPHGDSGGHKGNLLKEDGNEVVEKKKKSGHDRLTDQFHCEVLLQRDFPLVPSLMFLPVIQSMRL